MISVGAAIAFAIVAGTAGIAVGALIGAHERRSDHRTTVASEWGGIDAAATKAYRGAHGAPETLADARLWTAGDNRLRLLIFSDTVLQGEQWWLDSDGARELLGVEPEEILRRLIPA